MAPKQSAEQRVVKNIVHSDCELDKMKRGEIKEEPNVIGDALYPKVYELCKSYAVAQYAGKITGMLLEHEDRLKMLDSPTVLSDLFQEALIVLAEHESKGED